MSIATAITSLQSRVADAYDAVEAKGGTLPQVQNTTNLPTAISSIPQSGGSSSKFGVTIDDVFQTVTENDETTLTMWGGVTGLTFTGVTNIPDYGMYYKFARTGITSVSFPALTSVTNAFGTYCNAFSDCTSLTSVSFPELTTVSGKNPSSAGGSENGPFVYAFSDCTSLTSVSFPKLETVQSSTFENVLGCFEYAFSGCTSLATVSFPELTTISGGASTGTGTHGAFTYAFNGCTSLTSVSFPELTGATYKSFPNAFRDCTSLTSVSFPKLASISSYTFNSAFRGCTSLTSVSFPELTGASTSSFNGAFVGCTNLTSVSFPKLETINGTQTFNSAFGQGNSTSPASGVTTLAFPALTSIISNASAATTAVFNSNKALTRMDFPVLVELKMGSTVTTNNLTHIFDNCTALAELHFGADNQSVIEASAGYATKWGAPSTCTIYFDL